MAKKQELTTEGVTTIIPVERIERQIYLIRRQKVMFDSDLAALYQVPTKALNQAVRRNLGRFPDDFMFQLNKEELQNWKSQIVTSNPAAQMGLRKPPYVFTEHGVAMLASVLKGDRADEHPHRSHIYQAPRNNLNPQGSRRSSEKGGSHPETTRIGHKRFG